MAEDYGIRVTRVFEAPRERVWEEWTTPEAFADWFCGPFEIPVDSVRMDVRPGGAWQATMIRADGGETLWRGEYREVVPPERLELTITDAPGTDFHLVVVVLTDLGDGRTEMVFEQRGEMPPDQFERAEQGWGGFFDRIAARLAGGS
jgi:uncharacterized protein YndB with AHSA1/START domain